MLDTLMLITLAPILLWQGRRVRQRTLRLPEAVGERAGCQGQGQPLRVLLLGDSSAAGVGVNHQSNALAGQLAEQLSGQYQVTWQLLAQTGITSAQLLSQLQATVPQTYDCAVLAIGVNDVTARTSDALWLAQLQTLRKTLNAEFNVQHMYISAIPSMQHFSALPWPLRDYLGRRARRLNRLTAELAEHSIGLSFIPIGLAVNPQMLAADGFHPSAEAYTLWAEQIAALIKGTMFK